MKLLAKFCLFDRVHHDRYVLSVFSKEEYLIYKLEPSTVSLTNLGINLGLLPKFTADFEFTKIVKAIDDSGTIVCESAFGFNDDICIPHDEPFDPLLNDKDIYVNARILADNGTKDTLSGNRCIWIFVNTFGTDELKNSYREMFQKYYDENEYKAEPYDDNDLPPEFN